MPEITEPTLLVDENKCRANIRSMAAKAISSRAVFRPHFKTHQSIGIGRWFRDAGVKQIAVSSVRMAEYFAGDGWRDITIAIAFNILETGRVNSLTERGVRLNLTLDSIETAEFLKGRLAPGVGIFVKIDTGYHRTGIGHSDTGQVERTIHCIRESGLEFAGFLTHSGNSYRAGSREEIRGIHEDTVLKMNVLKNKFIRDYPELLISVGDTPTASVVEDFTGVDEIRPGNFIFYDLIQHELGACTFDRIAMILCAPVISRNGDRREIVVHAGAVHLSKDHLLNSEGNPVFGEVVLLTPGGWERCGQISHLVSLSQEHGIIHASDSLFRSVSIGDVLGIVPVHSCLAANFAGSYQLTTGERISRFRL